MEGVEEGSEGEDVEKRQWGWAVTSHAQRDLAEPVLTVSMTRRVRKEAVVEEQRVERALTAQKAVQVSQARLTMRAELLARWLRICHGRR